MKAVCVEGHLCADAAHAEHESERLQIGMPAVSRVVRLVFESTQQPGAWVSEHDEDELPVCRRRNAYGAEEKTQEFPCELMYKIFVKAFFFFVSSKLDGTNCRNWSQHSPQKAQERNRSHDFTFGAPVDKTTFTAETQNVKFWAGDVTGLKISVQLWQKSGRTLPLFHAFFFFLIWSLHTSDQDTEASAGSALTFPGF